MRVASAAVLAALAVACLCVVSVTAGTAETLKFYSGFTNTDCTRQIDIRSHLEEVIVDVKAKNTGNQEAHEYILAIRPEIVDNLSYVQAVLLVDSAEKENKEEGEKTGPTPVQVKNFRVELTGTSAPAGTQFYKLELPSAVKPGDSVHIQALLAYTDSLAPFPAEITQSENQFVKYQGNQYFFSPYPTLKQALSVKLGTKKTVSLTKSDAVKHEDEELHVGPFEESIAPYSFEALDVHFENNVGFVVFTSMVKEIEISMYGNVAVEDQYVLENKGARLKGPFSRYDYQRTGQKAANSFRHITAVLPSHVTDIYYRDQIGNISTTHVREIEEGQHLELLPRFPMFGGWKTDFYMGYNAPANEYLNYEYYDSSVYILNITFASPFPQATIEDLEVRIILPEYSGDIKWATPFDIDSEHIDKRTTYLDVSGRPVLVLRKRNLSRFHNQFFQVSFRFNRTMMFQRPILLIGGFVLFFAAAIVSSRFEMSIAPKSKKSAAAQSQRQGKVGSLINRVLAARQTLVATYEKHSRSTELADRQHSELHSLLQELSAAAVGDTGLADIIARLDNAEKELKGLAKRWAKASPGAETTEARAKYAQKLTEADGLASALASA